jgi:hypothetical protein
MNDSNDCNEKGASSQAWNIIEVLCNLDDEDIRNDVFSSDDFVRHVVKGFLNCGCDFEAFKFYKISRLFSNRPPNYRIISGEQITDP